MEITLNKGLDSHACISDGDLAALADWASDQKYAAENPAWKRAFALIREGADTLLRRRALSKDEPKPKETSYDSDSSA